MALLSPKRLHLWLLSLRLGQDCRQQSGKQKGAGWDANALCRISCVRQNSPGGQWDGSHAANECRHFPFLKKKIRTKISPYSKFTATAKNTGPVRDVLGVFGASVLGCWWLRELRELKMWVIVICRTFVGAGKEQNGFSVSSDRFRRHLTLWTMYFHLHVCSVCVNDPSGWVTSGWFYKNSELGLLTFCRTQRMLNHMKMR